LPVFQLYNSFESNFEKGQKIKHYQLKEPKKKGRKSKKEKKKVSQQNQGGEQHNS